MCSTIGQPRNQGGIGIPADQIGWKPMPRKAALLFTRGFDDLGEAARVEAGATDEGAVDVRLAHEFAGVLWFDAAAVLNPHSLGCRRRRPFRARCGG